MQILYDAFGWVIRTLFDLTGNYALSIILMTVLFNLLLIPLNSSGIKMTEKNKIMKPKIDELQRKYKDDKETLNRKMLELYKEHNFNPFAGCLPLLIQLPIIWALFTVMKDPLKYIFVSNPEVGKAAVEQGFLWIHNLSLPDQLSNVLSFDFARSVPGLLPIITAVLSYYQFEMGMPKPDSKNPAGNSMSTMKYTMPLMLLIFSSQLSAGLVLYWAVGTLFRIVQQLVIRRNAITKEA